MNDTWPKRLTDDELRVQRDQLRGDLYRAEEARDQSAVAETAVLLDAVAAECKLRGMASGEPDDFPASAAGNVNRTVLGRMADRLNTDVEGVLKMGGVDAKEAAKLEKGEAALPAKEEKKLRQHLAEEVDDAEQGGVPYPAVSSLGLPFESYETEAAKGYHVVKHGGEWRVQEPNGGLLKGGHKTREAAIKQAQAVNIKEFAPGKAKKSRDNYTYGPYQ